MYYKRPYSFRTSDYDSSDTIRISSVMDLCQYVAGIHADDIGVGFDTFKAKGYYWVITKLRFELVENPKPGTDVVVATWPLPNKRIEFIRNCKITDKENNLLVKCQTSWIVITEDRKIVKADKVSFNSSNYHMERLFDDDIERLHYEIPNDHLVKEHFVQNSDIDHNGHMNNSKYGDLILNFWDISIDKGYKTFEINFHKEAKLNDTIKIYKWNENNHEFYIGMVENEKCFTAKLTMEEN